MSLENILDSAISKEKLENQKYVNELKERWENRRIGANYIFEKLSFLKDKGVKISKGNDTDFDYSKAHNGFFPDVRIDNMNLITISKSGDEGDDIRVSGIAQFSIRGESHTFESFLKKIACNFC